MATSDSDTERFSVNQRLKWKISKEFKERVDPVLLNDALSHKVRLTQKHEDEMRAKLDYVGRWKACDYLFTQLVKKRDWFKYLLIALADPHVGMEDFAETCKQAEAEVKRHSGETTTDSEEAGYLKLLDEHDGIGASRIVNEPVQYYNEDINEDVYEDFYEDNFEDNGTNCHSIYDDAVSLPFAKRVPGRQRGSGHGGTQRTIQHGKVPGSPLQNDYSTAYDHIGPASSLERHQESVGARRGEVLPQPVLLPLPEQYDDDGYTQIYSRDSPSLVRPDIRSRDVVPHRSPQYDRETAAATSTHVATYRNSPEDGQPLTRAASSPVRSASSLLRGKSDDDERTRLSTIYSPDSWKRSSSSGFRSSVVSVPELSPDHYNPYGRTEAEVDQTLVSRRARDINQQSGNSDNFLLRPTPSSRKDVLRLRENSCREDHRERHEGISRGSHRDEGKQHMSQKRASSSQRKACSDLDRGVFFGTPSDSTQREGEADYPSKGEGHSVPAETAESNMPTTKGAKEVAAGGDFTRAEVDTELTNFPGYTPNITDHEVRNRMQRCKDNTYILWYSESEQRPTLGVVYNSTFMTFAIKKRSSFNGTKFYVDRDQKDGYSLTELLKYHLDAGIKDTRPSSYRQKIMLKYPFLE